ncbi:LysR family transcriptional regulator [Mesobacterium pallidum]|uniref:LysR family transcriptional regulator n=1 Tax=Mesobacterium pallidum TaxID=2872037 RepID=UPI001EE17B61
MLNYTLKQLRYVEAAGRLGSIASAASELSISQSSITAAIDALEGGLGYDMFIRTPARGIRPTPQGTEALGLIRRFLHQARHFEAEMQSVAGLAKGTVRIACYATAAPAFLPTILRSVTETFPDLSITVLEGSLNRVTDFLNEGEADLAFSYKDFSDPRHRFEPLFEAPPYAIVPRDDPIAQSGVTTMAEIATRPMVTLDLPGARDYFRSMFDDLGLSPRIAHSTRSSEILRALVSGGFGVSILNIKPLDYREGESSYAIVPIQDAGPAPMFGILTVGNSEPPGIVQAFIRNCIILKSKGEFRNLAVHLPAHSHI